MTWSLAKEANVALAVAAMNVHRFLHDWKNSLTFVLFFPVVFLGILAVVIGQNVGSGLGYDYLQFALLGTTAFLLMQFCIMSVTSLVEERETGFTQEIFVSPASRGSIFIGKILGGSVTSLVQLPMLCLIGFLIGMPITPALVCAILLVSPVLFLMGGAFGVLISGMFGTSPKAADQAGVMIMFPQMFLSGALIPIRNSSGALEVHVRLMPLTYVVDLLRGLFYNGTPTYGQTVLYNPVIDLAIYLTISVTFLVVGMVLFVRGERNG
jgi:ABC-2 type transport system permease protein